MIVILPALYLIAAQLTSCLVRRWGKVAGLTYLAAQVGLMGQPLLAYYTTQINEQWRDSAALVLHMPGCKSGTIHVYGDPLNYRFFSKWVAPDLRLIDIRRERPQISAMSPLHPARLCFGQLVFRNGISVTCLSNLVFRAPP
jgi:hypothetical protein